MAANKCSSIFCMLAWTLHCRATACWRDEMRDVFYGQQHFLLSAWLWSAWGWEGWTWATYVFSPLCSIQTIADIGLKWMSNKKAMLVEDTLSVWDCCLSRARGKWYMWACSAVILVNNIQYFIHLVPVLMLMWEYVYTWRLCRNS